MEELYFTIAGCSHYFGSDFMEKGMKDKKDIFMSDLALENEKMILFLEPQI